jgi:hypothetical protein
MKFLFSCSFTKLPEVSVEQFLTTFISNAEKVDWNSSTLLGRNIREGSGHTRS